MQATHLLQHNNPPNTVIIITNIECLQVRSPIDFFSSSSLKKTNLTFDLSNEINFNSFTF